MGRLTDLSDKELVSRLEAIWYEGHGLLARLLAHLVEVEERRLHLEATCSSMFEFCIRRLGMSEGEAFRRINAARLVRRFPGLLARIERREVHLSTLVLLRDHLTEANVEELVDAASGKSKRQVQELVAQRTPRPDVPGTIRKLPTRAAANEPLTLPSGVVPARSVGTTRLATIEPLSEARYKIQLTASRALRDKLERARDLLSHRNASGDLAVVVERALDALLDELEKERLGKTARPPRKARAARTPNRPSRVTRAARRAVFERDGEQCAFVDEQGRRCTASRLLELDHIDSRALGGSDDVANLRVLCRPHNLLHAEKVFGREHVAQRIRFRQRKSAPARETLDRARRGLVNMGFREKEARRALDTVSERHRDRGPPPPIEEIFREALAVLT